MATSSPVADPLLQASYSFKSNCAEELANAGRWISPLFHHHLDTSRYRLPLRAQEIRANANAFMETIAEFSNTTIKHNDSCFAYLQV